MTSGKTEPKYENVDIWVQTPQSFSPLLPERRPDASPKPVTSKIKDEVWWP